MSAEAKQEELGLCCACGSREATGVAMLYVKGPSPGKGWGCVVCGIPSDGALVVLSNRCGRQLERGDDDHVKFAIKGYLYDGERVAVAELTEPFDHDLSKHPELRDEQGGDYLGARAAEFLSQS